MSDTEQPLVVITNDQKKKLITLISGLAEVGHDVADNFRQHSNFDEEEKEFMASAITLAILAFPWGAALNLFVDDEDSDKVRLAWSLAEAMGSEFAEFYHTMLSSMGGSNVKH